MNTLKMFLNLLAIVCAVACSMGFLYGAFTRFKSRNLMLKYSSLSPWANNTLIGIFSNLILFALFLSIALALALGVL